MTTRASVRSSGGLSRAAARLRAMAGDGPVKAATRAIARHMVTRVRGAWGEHSRTGAAVAAVRADVGHHEVRIYEAAYRPYVRGLEHQLRIPDQWRREVLVIVSRAFRGAR